VVDLLMGRDLFPQASPQEIGHHVEGGERPVPFGQMPGIFEKLGNELPPPQIAHEIFGVVIGVEIPLLPLAVLMAEFAHLGLMVA